MADRERQVKSECPHCGHWDSKVMQGWPDERGYTRRRKCRACSQVWRTREVTINKKTTISSRNLRTS